MRGANGGVIQHADCPRRYAVEVLSTDPFEPRFTFIIHILLRLTAETTRVSGR